MSTRKDGSGAKKNATNLSKHSLKQATDNKDKRKNVDVNVTEKNKTKKVITTSNKETSKQVNDVGKKTFKPKLKEDSNSDASVSSFRKSKYISSSKLATNKLEKTTNKNQKVKPDEKILKQRNIIQNNQSDKISKHVLDSNKSITERPRTATLVKGTIVNANTSKDISISSTSPPPDDDYNYEEDFESYESDFEAYSSSSSINIESTSNSLTSSTSTEDISMPPNTFLTTNEDEKTLDSGHFEMTDYKHVPILNNIKELIENENSHLVLANNPASLSDEGFEEQKSLQFVNFLEAKKKNERKRSIQLKQERGKEILNMIKLDSCSFTLINLEPIPYEKYLQFYGNSNITHTFCQTGYDGIDEEIQTNELIYTDKSTQQPEVFINSKNLSTDIENNAKIAHSSSLNKFILSTGKVILKLLDESNVITVDNTNNNSSSFGEISYEFNTSSDIFINSFVSYISFSCDISTRIITIHRKSEGSLIAIWNMCNYDQPEQLFLSYGIITCCSTGFLSSYYELVFTGFEDGSILIWDGSSSIYQNESISCVPVFTTGISLGHCAKIIALHFISNISEKETDVSQINELCSIDETGLIILWTVFIKSMNKQGEFGVKDDISLVKNTVISLGDLHSDLTDLLCTDFISSRFNSDYLFISTNKGFIIHHLVKTRRRDLKLFTPGFQSIVTSLESCPFSSEYFLAGYDNGSISLYSIHYEKPLMVLSDKENKTDCCSIASIQWCRNNPTVIYAKDSKNQINVWDLNQSDMFPVQTFSFKEDITFLKIHAVGENTEKQHSIMLMGTNKGKLRLYHLGEPQSTGSFKESTKIFLNYVNRL